MPKHGEKIERFVDRAFAPVMRGYAEVDRKRHLAVTGGRPHDHENHQAWGVVCHWLIGGLDHQEHAPDIGPCRWFHEIESSRPYRERADIGARDIWSVWHVLPRRQGSVDLVGGWVLLGRVRAPTKTEAGIVAREAWPCHAAVWSGSNGLQVNQERHLPWGVEGNIDAFVEAESEGLDHE